jgi:hypothetical protein
VVDDSLSVLISEKVDSIRVIGQGGQVRAIATGTDRLRYPIREEDRYLRVEFYTPRVVAYSSALCRGEGPVRRLPPPENSALTWLWRLALLHRKTVIVPLRWRVWPEKSCPSHTKA